MFASLKLFLEKVISKGTTFLPIAHYSLLITFFFASSCLASALSVNATATLSRNRIAAGDMVQLDIKVTGAQQADVPPEIAAEGLQIKLTGQSSEVQMINFNVSSSVIYSYIVVPLKTGNLTIPPVTVRAEGQVMKTTPLSLAVIGSGTGTTNTSSQGLPALGSISAPSRMASQHGNNTDPDRLGFAEIVIPKKKFYVGEVVPVEIRFYIDARYGFSTMGPPNFGGEGILTDRFKDPEQNREERNGVIYTVATFRTLFAAVKPGVLDLPPTTLDIVVAIPEATPAGIDADLFSRLLGGRSPFVQEHKMTLKANAIHCEVMPLPTEGRPTDFSGAIGEFRLDGAVIPQKVTQGDPVTLSLKLSGKGNFQALKGPQLTETQGWRTYPPAEHFESSDVFGWKGVKTFETTMIAQQAVTATPGSSFSYFDPVATKYVTLTTKPLPLEMLAGASTSTPVSTSAPSKVAAAPSPVPNSHPPSISGERLNEKTEHSWKDPLHRKEWVLTWCALFFMATALLTFLTSRLYAQRRHSSRQQEEEQLADLVMELEEEELSVEKFFEKAASIAKLLLKSEDLEKVELEEILQRHEEIQYGARLTFLQREEKERLIELLRQKIMESKKHSKS